ncbi:putative mRNA 3-end processing factor [Parapedobacter composti]|uniref:Putative mRNA 3-end processing factor n=1 Tax=Parapedobacter composti TaxID=623281 RepID=A0A1I1JP38_9SPHI|nr:MBL fold metallo-hydrolase [Parapedobacter composti]SFC48288.1 putative mRNA 3-end processing factor [Parapedobacter composti]
MGKILPDFLIKRPEGYYCRYGDFYVDPLLPVNLALVSHAHGDHATPGHREICCTAATAAFMRYRYNKQPAHTYTTFSYHQPFTIGSVAIRFIPAGHMLGSAQILMEYGGVRYLYTGDYKMQADSTCEPLEMVEADVLITESTFADPGISHPDPAVEIMKLKEKPHPILLGAYALGKAQRLTALINEHCPSRRILLHHSILPLHRLYESMGITQLRYEPYNRKMMKVDGADHIYIVPPMTFNSYYRATNVLRVFASGWKHLQHRNDMELYISDHVDWQDILDYVVGVNPREIWTVHGNGSHLREHFADQIVVRTLGELQSM